VSVSWLRLCVGEFAITVLCVQENVKKEVFVVLTAVVESPSTASVSAKDFSTSEASTLCVKHAHMVKTMNMTGRNRL